MKTLRIFFLSIAVIAFGIALEANAQTSQQPPDLPWEKVWIPAKEGGRNEAMLDIKLEASLVKPKGSGPFPLVIFSHGSTGHGAIPEKRTLRPNAVAPEFLKRGFAVIAPMRRGRGESGGRYDEPYDCNSSAAAVGLQNAIQDLDYVVQYVKTLPQIDSSRIVLSGHSRGGILSVVYASKRPGLGRGVINFVGGWTSDRCSGLAGGFNENTFGDATAAAAVTKVPMLFLYAENDSYYAPSSIKHFASLFEKAGGTVLLRLYGPIGRDGHALGVHPQVWGQDLHDFLEKLGFPLL